MTSYTYNNYFATCPRGLETLLETELQQLDIEKYRVVKGGIHFQADVKTCFLLNYSTRFASRVWQQIAKTRYYHDRDFYKWAFKMPWTHLFDVKQSFRIDVTAVNSPLRSVNIVALKIKDAICDHFRDECNGIRPDVNKDNPDVRLQIFLDHEYATLYLDTSGDTLFKRGWRCDTEKSEAPLKEHLAAGLVAQTQWAKNVHLPLVDASCGSGTLFIEAIFQAWNIPSGVFRESFGMENIRGCQGDDAISPKQFDSWRQEALENCIPVHLKLYVNDISTDALTIAKNHWVDVQNNLPKQLQQSLDLIDITWLQQDLRTLHLNLKENLENNEIIKKGIFICNPPYGERLVIKGTKQLDLHTFWKEIGDNLKQQWAGWDAWFLYPIPVVEGDPVFIKMLGLKPSKKIEMFNGNLDCRWMLFELMNGFWKKGTGNQP